MALGPRLDLRQSQQLVMTPQLQQAIKLLQLTNLELESFLTTEMERNPLLEVGEAASEPGADAAPGEGERFDGEPAGDGFEADEPTTSDRLLSSDGVVDGGESPLDVDLNADVFQHDSVSDQSADRSIDEMATSSINEAGLSLNGSGAISGGGEDDFAGVDLNLAEEASLHAVLNDQAGVAFSDPESLLLARHLIDLIDDAGYFRGNCADIAQAMAVEPAFVERVLAVIQTFDPTGVGARSLSECLKLQAREADRLDPAMETLLDHLDLLARGEMQALRRLCRVDAEDLADMVRELRAYNPKPGLAYGGERVQAVTPDVFVRQATSGGWVLELNTATLPRVLVNRSYYSELVARSQVREERLFLSECLTSANWLIKALDQRARTILKVATEIVRQQEGFFESGVRALKPLNLRTIAEAIGMHESTISRVTSNKYLSCTRGVFELKYFFSSGIAMAETGESVAAAAVKNRIRELIDAENPQAILSDDSLVDLLQAEKFDIARRTVAKYREALRIPSSVQRRRLKAMG